MRYGGKWRCFFVYSFAPSRPLSIVGIVVLIIVVLVVGLFVALQQLLHFVIPELLIVFHLSNGKKSEKKEH